MTAIGSGDPGSPRCWAVLPAAGIGARMGGELPKQYLQLAGSSLLEHSLGALLACSRIETVAVALHPEDERAASLLILADPRVQRVTGGAQRADSVLAGLEVLLQQAGPGDWVLVHDAARPCLAQQDLERLIAQVTGSGVGGLLAEPITDTVKRVDSRAQVLQTLDRDSLWRAQTPQMFRLRELYDALAHALREGLAVTDEASAMEMAGYPVQLIEGSPRNLKVTRPIDLELADWYLAADSSAREQ